MRSHGRNESYSTFVELRVIITATAHPAAAAATTANSHKEKNK